MVYIIFDCEGDLCYYVFQIVLQDISKVYYKDSELLFNLALYPNFLLN